MKASASSTVRVMHLETTPQGTFTKGTIMNRTKTLLTTATLIAVGTLALPAWAQQAPTPAPAPAPTPTPVATTTTTAAEPSADTTAGPSAPDAHERDTITVKRAFTPNRPLLVTGGILLVGAYVPTAVVASTQGRAVEDSNLLIPVVGPWLNLADRRCEGCDGETGNVALVIGSGVLQGVGAIMTAMSFFVPEKVDAATIQAGPVKLQVAPAQMGRYGMGIGTVGVF